MCFSEKKGHSFPPGVPLHSVIVGGIFPDWSFARMGGLSDWQAPTAIASLYVPLPERFWKRMLRTTTEQMKTPLPVRVIWGLFQWCSSLKLAVILILLMASILGLGTFIEAAYGTPAAQFGVYQTSWFGAVNALLAVNIFCAAAIRFPWKRHQTGFVITHCGLLVLLTGALISRLSGVDSQMPIYEEGTAHIAFSDAMSFRLSVEHDKPNASGRSPKATPETVTDLPLIPFQPGPFNWPDYATIFDFNQPREPNGLALAPWKLFRSFCGLVFEASGRARSGSVLHDHDGIRLETLDFFSDSRAVNAPSVTIMMSMPTAKRIGPDGKSVDAPPSWMPMQLAVTPATQPDKYPNGMGDRKSAGGGQVFFWMASSQNEVTSFLKNAPEGNTGSKGQIVLRVDGKKTFFNVDEKVGKGRFALLDAEAKPLPGWEAEVADYWPAASISKRSTRGNIVWENEAGVEEPKNPGARIKLYRDGKSVGELDLFAKAPDVNAQAFDADVFGDYWLRQEDKKTARERMMASRGSRIDIIQGPGEKLYYRYWNRKKVVLATELPAKGAPETAVNTFTMPIAQLKMYVEEYIPSDTPTSDLTLPLPFNRSQSLGARRAVARVRMTVDDVSEEFWLQVYMGEPGLPPRLASQKHTVAGKGRKVTITLPLETEDIGVRVRLTKFERKLDPGTSQAAHFSSTIDLVDRDRDRTILRADFSGQGMQDLKLPTPKTSRDVASADALALDAPNAILYWTDSKQGTIQRAKLQDGADAEVDIIIDAHLNRPLGLVLDLSAEKIYWSDQRRGAKNDEGVIRRANLDGTQMETVVHTAGRPEALALNVGGRFLYWVDTRLNSIGRVSLDSANSSGGESGGGGFQNKAEEQFISGLNEPAGVAFDETRQKLYWTETEEGVIRSANADGGEQHLVWARQSGESPVRLAVDSEGGWIYWSDRGVGEMIVGDDGLERPLRVHRVRRAKITTGLIDDADVQDVASRGVDEPGDLVLDPENNVLYWAQSAAIRRDVWITMNAPIEFSDPHTGKTYRLFQESFDGPWKPGDAEYERHAGPDSTRADLYLSVLSANYDPGRWVRNVGCLLISLGIGAMFYMRSYFLTGRRRAASE